MAVKTDSFIAPTKRRLATFWQPYTRTAMLSWLTGALVAAILEQLVGRPLAFMLGLGKVPVLFGLVIILKTPLLIPGVIVYVLLIYILPIGLIARVTTQLGNKLAAQLLRYPMLVSTIVHLILLYTTLQIWGNINDYRNLVLRLTLISVLITLSLNVINGYMGEFSCSHPGFLALGAYGASAVTVSLFVNDNLFGPAIFTGNWGWIIFPFSLILGGIIAAIGSLVVAIPSFRTRGDYLAIISLAFTFIIKSFIENLEFVGGPRGLSSQPDWANLPTVFIWVVVGVWVINNFVRSTMGKALNAVRDDEIAADAMTVNTRRTKMVAFMFSAFWAGVGGGLFAHVLRYVNPSTFGIQKLAEVLAMVYFGGLNSVYGSIVGAVGFNLLSEALRPLEIFKWIIIPVLLILIMIFRPTGLVAFKEFDVHQIIAPKE